MQTLFSNDYRLCIIGCGGFGREVLCHYIDLLTAMKIDYKDKIVFAVEDQFRNIEAIMGFPVLFLSKMDFYKYPAVVAISDIDVRRKIVAQLPEHVQFATIIHPTVNMSQWVDIGEGSIICPRSVLTCNISIGRHSHINLGTTIGHDFRAGDFLTTSPGVAISGEITVGHNVFIGANASIRQRLFVADNAVIGMGAAVVKDINEAGVYAGVPAKKLH